MKQEQLIALVERRHEKATDLLLREKREEYERKNDRLHNFKVAARMDNETPEQALWGMYKKHIVSMIDMIHDTVFGTVPSEAMMNAKMNDLHNYLYLLEGLLEERRNGERG